MPAMSPSNSPSSSPSKRRAILFVVAWICALWSTSATANNFTEAQSKVRSVIETFLGDIKNIKRLYEEDKAQYYRFVKDITLPVIATDLSARVILGSHWKAATADQRKKFISGLDDMLIRTYGKALIVLDEVKLEYLPAPEDTDLAKKVQTVVTTVTTGDGSKVKVGYVMIKVGNDWKLFDLIIDSLSMVKQLRGSFEAEIKETGLDALITRLGSEQ